MAGEDFERAADLVELAIPATAPGSAGGHTASLARGASRRADPGQARAQHRVCRGADGRRRGRGRRGAPAGRRAVAGRRTAAVRIGAPSAEMVVVDDEEFRASQARSRCTAPDWPWSSGDVAGTMTHARRALDLAGEDDHLAVRSGGACWGSRTGRAGTSRRRTAAYAEGMAGLRAGRARLRHVRLRDRPGGHPDRARSSPRRDAHLRAGLKLRGAACPSKAGRCCGGRRTCTSGMSRDPPRAQRLDGRHRGTCCASRELGEHAGSAAEPVPLAGRDGPDPGGRRRSGRRARPARRGGAPVRQ